MPQAIWTGSISFGLVNIPVAFRPLIETEKEVSGRMLCPEHMKPIKLAAAGFHDEFDSVSSRASIWNPPSLSETTTNPSLS
mgnify:CR=1 FL=1